MRTACCRCARQGAWRKRARELAPPLRSLAASMLPPWAVMMGCHWLGYCIFARGRRDRFPGTDQFADAGRPHLPHQVAAVQLHRDIADAEVEGDLLVALAACQLARDLALASRKRRQALGVLPRDPFRGPLHDVPLDPDRDGVEQRLVAE